MYLLVNGDLVNLENRDIKRVRFINGRLVVEYNDKPAKVFLTESDQYERLVNALRNRGELIAL